MKKFKIAFSAFCIILCILPFISMSFAKTDSTSENRRLAQTPELLNNGKINSEYLQQAGKYFDDHYAFRNAMINADSLIQSNAFGVSNAGTVVKGKNDWLYYTDTLDDFQGKAKLSERGVYNASRNISIMQSFAKSKGIGFAITIAPNKNSLYGENMPYYTSFSYNQKKTIDSLVPLLKDQKVNYVDLFALFGSHQEVLYLKRDSHWSNKGALLVYNELMDNLAINHNDYSTSKVIRKKTEIGDLNRMLYPISAKPEWNCYYNNEDGYKYVSDTKSVEDAWIETSSSSNNGKLLMFRDSFGNTLLPFFAGEFEKSYFSKGVPYMLESYVEQYNPDYIIVEKVERNIDGFAFDPPVLTLQSDYKVSENTRITDCATVNISEYDGDASYITISGKIDESCLENNSDIYVLTDNKLYNAFNLSDETGDNGYKLFLKKDSINEMSEISIIVSTNGNDIIVKKAKADFVNLSSHEQ